MSLCFVSFSNLSLTLEDCKSIKLRLHSHQNHSFGDKLSPLSVKVECYHLDSAVIIVTNVRDRNNSIRATAYVQSSKTECSTPSTSIQFIIINLSRTLLGP